MQPDLLLALDIAARAAALPLGVEVVRRLADAYRDRAYGCLTRVGLERRWTGRGAVLFFDINRMHQLNTALGYREVDRRIREVLAEVCRAGEAMAARWQSGDEIVIWLRAGLDAVAHIVARLQAALAARGIDAMFATAPAQRDLVATVAAASDQVQAMKRERDRARLLSRRAIAQRRRWHAMAVAS